MNKKMIRPIQLFILLMALDLISCNILGQIDQYPGPGSYDEIRYYTFEPGTLLLSLERNETDVFKPISKPIDDNIFPSGSFQWRQIDYLRVAEALYFSATANTLEDWKIYKMSFDRNCGDDPTGFDSAKITYFKEDGSSSYVAQAMYIYPLAKEVDWGKGNTRFPRPLFGWKSIDIKRLKVTAEGALQVAEMNGGKDARLAVGNKCRISLLLPSNISNGDWDVFYNTDGTRTIFQVIINPYSGKYRILPPDA
jgi:hypothetical protein